MRPRLIAVGQIPPPMTGYAHITARMIETLGDSASVETIDVSPGERKGFIKHVFRSRQTLRACWRIARNDAQHRLMYMGCEGDWGLIYTAMLTLTSRLFGYTLFLHHHSFSYIDKSFRLMRLILIFGGRDLRHIFLCTTMRDRFESRYGKMPHSYIISNAAFVDPAPRLEERAGPPGPLRIGLLSNLTREKGLHTFLELLRLLRQYGLDVAGVLAGPIVQEEDRVMVGAAEKELLGALQYIGPVYADAKDHFYRQIDVFIFPTEYANEAQPTVLFEALAAGNSIVAFDRGCIAAQVGTNGIAISPTDDFCMQAHEYIAQRIRNRDHSAAERQSILDSYREAQASARSSAHNLLPASHRIREDSRSGLFGEQ